MGLIVNAHGNKAYFASDRIKEKGEDIYEFDLYKEARPSLVSYMEGIVFNAETKVPLSAKFELIDLNTAKTTMQAKSSANGEFEVCIPTDKDYALHVSAKGYLFFSENFTMTGVNDKTKPFLMDVPMQPIKPGVKIILKNIFFETNSYELKSTSIAELGKLIQFMKENTAVRIEIGGYTDNQGSDSFNLILSENRAKTVVDYIVKNGIDMSRLNYKGYGKSNPVADNNTEEGRSKNRRTEFMIIK
jgi:outer membrane protein OmpA-like peptidoglycan-associated protein